MVLKLNFYSSWCLWFISAEPYQPHNLKEGDHTTTSANISWKSGCNGGAAQTFHIEYKKTETRNIIWTLGPSVPQLSDSDNEEYNSEITDLDPDILYHVRIKASNIIGQNTSDSIEGGWGSLSSWCSDKYWWSAGDLL